jgi:periplasmic protein TonB
MKSIVSATAMAAGFLLPQTSLLTRVVPPVIPVQAAGGGEVLLQVSLGSAGAVADITVLRDAPPFTPPLRQAVAGWRFAPDVATRVPGGRVLVAGSFRSPVLLEVGPLPSPPADLPASPTVPVPVRWLRPGYPANGIGDAVVILQASVGADGSVGDLTTVYGAPPLASAAVEAARQWRFRPAAVGGAPVATVAFLVFGFRQPFIPAAPPPPSS